MAACSARSPPEPRRRRARPANGLRGPSGRRVRRTADVGHTTTQVSTARNQPHGRAVTPRSGESPRAHGPDAASADSGGRSRRNLADPPLASRCFGDQEQRLLRDTCSRRSAGRAGGRAAEWTKQVICARTGSAHVQLFTTQVCLWLGEPRVSVAWRAAADCRRAQDELRRTGPAPRAAEAIATVAAHRPLSSLGVLLPHRRTTRLIRLRARPPFEPMAHPFSEVTRRGVSNDKLDAPARRDRQRALSSAHRRGDFAVAVQPRS